MSFSDFVSTYWQDITAWVVMFEIVVTVGALLAVLHLKREPMSAIAWSLTVILLPILGSLLFLVFGYQSVHRRLAQRRQRGRAYKEFARRGGEGVEVPPRWNVLARLGQHSDGYPVTAGNAVTLFTEGTKAFDAMAEAIERAQHNVHIQFFIFRPDQSGRRFIELLSNCARRGVEVRFLLDSVGSFNLPNRLLRGLKRDGGKVASFLPLFNPFRVNLRNHRKVLVVDGRVAFSGGLNIGDEYLGLSPKFGYWRDTHFRVEGSAAEGFQQAFLEDWYFAAGEAVTGAAYYPEHDTTGTTLAQVVASGPDADFKAIRETYLAAIIRAKQRAWIASPYFVPDTGLRDAMLLAARSGVDVRFLGLFRPDKWVPFLAARYYWGDMIDAGVKVYQYARGMMHSKFVLVDGEWASVGSANMDNRSLHLNFELNCQFFDTAMTQALEAAFLKDLEWSVRLDPELYAKRPFVGRLAENACRLFSPVL